MKANPVRRRFGRILAATAAAALVVGGGAAAASAHKQQPVSLTGLKVLLTNDDSMQAARPNNSDGLGLFEVRKALCAAGADVVVIAPWQVQSGRGTAVSNSGSVRLATKTLPNGYEGDCSGAPTGGLVYGLCLDTAPCGPTSPSATPVDTVKFATRGGLAAVAGWAEPDLVVSGSNSGLNVANSVNDSGTVSATVAAIEDGIPAVAFSSSATADFATYAVANYRATAQWGAQLLVGLRAKGLLEQSSFALSVNYPNVAEGAKARSAVWASVGTGAVAWHSYDLQDDGSYKIGLALCADRPDCTESRSDADAPAVLKRNRITVVPVDWDRTYGLAADSKRLLAKVRAYVEHNAPAPVNP